MTSEGNGTTSSNLTRICFSEISGPLAITSDHFMVAQMKDVSKVVELLAIKENQARLLLMQYRWNLERVFDALDRKGKERLFTESGIPVVKDDAVGLPMLCAGDGFSLCTVCFEEVDTKEVTRMECGHHFCNHCWTDYFITSIDNGHARRIKCMAIQCSYVCNYQTVHLLISAQDPLIAARFEHLVMDSYIDDNDRACWCPSNPPCGRAILLESHSDPFCDVECVCGTQFCFNCLSEAHSPCTCQIWRMWANRCGKANIGWIITNTKTCPGCGNAVIKNGGCNHMTCRCGQKFCWLCGGPTGKSHLMLNHSCNRFTKIQPKEPREPKTEEPTSQNISRYMHYCERYYSHNDSLQKEILLRQNLEKHSMFLCPQSMDGPDWEQNWVLIGYEKLLVSRRLLTYTYPFAFYMFGDELLGNNLKNKEIRQDLFEDQQQQLECCVEKLAMEFERNFDKVSPFEVTELRMRVINLSRLLDNCCRNIHAVIQEELLPHLGPTEFISQYKVEKAKEINYVGCI